MTRRRGGTAALAAANNRLPRNRVIRAGRNRNSPLRRDWLWLGRFEISTCQLQTWLGDIDGKRMERGRNVQ